MDSTSTNVTVLLRPSEVAELAGVSKGTIYNWLRKRGMVSSTHTVSGEPLFTQSEAEAVAALAERRRQVRESLKVSV